MKMLLVKSVVLNFTSNRNKKLERMSTDFKLYSRDDIVIDMKRLELEEEEMSKKMEEEKLRNSLNESVIDKISSEIALKIDDIKRKSKIDDHESIRFEGGESEDESGMRIHLSPAKLNRRNKKISDLSDASPSLFRSERSSRVRHKKLITLKEISAILARRKTEGYLSSKDTNIFPLSKGNSKKFLQTKDFVEIAIRY